MKVEHIGIAVSDLDASVLLFEKLLNTECYKREVVNSEQVETAFFKTGDTKVELLGATSPDSVIHKFIDKRGQGMHHIAFHVDDIHSEIKRLQDEGFELLTNPPKPGADNKLIAFLHPRTTNGVLIELCQPQN